MQIQSPSAASMQAGLAENSDPSAANRLHARQRCRAKRASRSIRSSARRSTVQMLASMQNGRQSSLLRRGPRRGNLQRSTRSGDLAETRQSAAPELYRSDVRFVFAASVSSYPRNPGKCRFYGNQLESELAALLNDLMSVQDELLAFLAESANC